MASSVTDDESFASLPSSLPSSSSSATADGWKYDVFLSFRGQDTRRNFTDRLAAALSQKGIRVWRDDAGLERGVNPPYSRIYEAIEHSRFCIIVFSRYYASSTWCLEELLKIFDCVKRGRHAAFPVFYGVDPTEVRQQTGTYGEAFAAHKELFKDDLEKVQRWRVAMTELANLPGLDLQCRHEVQCIQEIVHRIHGKLRISSDNIFSIDTEDYVGLHSRLEELIECLHLERSEVRIVGICGIGGIGKTTLSKFVYGRMLCQFETGCFLENVRVVDEKHGLVYLQNQLLSEVLQKGCRIESIHDGKDKIKNKLHRRRVLVVLDNVDCLSQLESLAGKRNWFGMGSRIIITTRDEHLLKAHGVDGIYRIRKPDHDEALQLFYLRAFKNSSPAEGYVEMSKSFVKYASGLPFALTVLGSHLYGRSIKEWRSVLGELERVPNQDIFYILKIIFDSLDGIEKKIFLGIACFFVGDHVEKVSKLYNLRPETGLKVLIEKSLLTISQNKVWMHDLLLQLGREIVQRENEKLGPRRLLWNKKLGLRDLQLLPRKDSNPVASLFSPLPSSLIHVASPLPSLSTLCSLTQLGLSYCNLRDLRGNDFKSSLSSIGGLSRLKKFNLGDYRRLQSLPYLPSSIKWEGCKSMPTIQPSIGGLNSKLTENQEVFVAPFLKNKHQGISSSQGFSVLMCSVAGGIPKWFNYVSRPPSMKVELPPHWSNDGWLGFCIYAVFGFQDSKAEYNFYISVQAWITTEKSVCLYLHRDSVPTYSCFQSVVGSLHFIPCDKSVGLDWWNSLCHLEVSITDGRLKAKDIGLRIVYQQDVKELTGSSWPFSSPSFHIDVTMSKQSLDDGCFDVSELDPSLTKKRLEDVSEVDPRLTNKRLKHPSPAALRVSSFLEAEEVRLLVSTLPKVKLIDMMLLREQKLISRGRLRFPFHKDLGEGSLHSDSLASKNSGKLSVHDRAHTEVVQVPSEETLQVVKIEEKSLIDEASSTGGSINDQLLKFLFPPSHGPRRRFQASASLRNALRFFQCHVYLSKSLPVETFCAENLVELNLISSNIKQLWAGKQRLGNLILLDVSHTNLTGLPYLSEAKKLHIIKLQDCINLLEVSSIQFLTHLKNLSLKGCKNLQSLPPMAAMKCMKVLNLSDCSGLEELPESIGCLSALVTLDLRNCKRIKCLPSSIAKLESLVTLDIAGCQTVLEQLSETERSEMPTSNWFYSIKNLWDDSMLGILFCLCYFGTFYFLVSNLKSYFW